MKNKLKSIFALLLLLAMTFSLAACGSTTAQHQKPSGGSQSSTPPIGGNQTEPPEHEEESSSNITSLLSVADNFSDGVAFVNVARYEDGKYRGFDSVVIDTTGTVLFYMDDLEERLELELNVFYDFSSYQNGLSVCSFNSWGVQEFHAAFDKNGNIVISAEKNGFDEILAYSADHRYFIVGKTIEAFDGDKYMIGVIDNTGNYVQPLSQENLLGVLAQQAQESNCVFNIEYVQDDIFAVYIHDKYAYSPEAQCYYHASKNSTTKNYDHVELDNYGNLHQYEESGERIQLFEDKNIEHLFEDAVLVSTNGEYALLDYDGNVLLDLSRYEITRQMWETSSDVPFHYKNGYFLTQMKNATGALYCCLFDAEGNFVHEPIRMGDDDYFYALFDEGFIYRKGSPSIFAQEKAVWFFYRCNGTVETLEEAPYDPDDYSFHDGLMRIRGTMSSEECFFFVNKQWEIVISGATLKEKMT